MWLTGRALGSFQTTLKITMHLVSSGNLCLLVKNPVSSDQHHPSATFLGRQRGAPALRKGVKALEPGASGSILTIYQPGDLGQVFQRKGQILISGGGGGGGHCVQKQAR